MARGYSELLQRKRKHDAIKSALSNLGVRGATNSRKAPCRSPRSCSIKIVLSNQTVQAFQMQAATTRIRWDANP